MEWLTKPPAGPRPRQLDIRWRTMFAWFPVDCVDGKTRWLTFVQKKEQFFVIEGWKGKLFIPNEYRTVKEPINYDPPMVRCHRAFCQTETQHPKEFGWDFDNYYHWYCPKH